MPSQKTNFANSVRLAKTVLPNIYLVRASPYLKCTVLETGVEKQNQG